MKHTQLKSDIQKNIGDRLSFAKKNTNMSNLKLASLTQMSNAQISRILQGKNVNMTISTIYNLAEALECNPAWLAFGIGKPYENVPKETAFDFIVSNNVASVTE